MNISRLNDSLYLAECSAHVGQGALGENLTHAVTGK